MVSGGPKHPEEYLRFNRTQQNFSASLRKNENFSRLEVGVLHPRHPSGWATTVHGYQIAQQRYKD
jgi:hypothetical protein